MKRPYLKVWFVDDRGMSPVEYFMGHPESYFLFEVGVLEIHEYDDLDDFTVYFPLSDVKEVEYYGIRKTK